REPCQWHCGVADARGAATAQKCRADHEQPVGRGGLLERSVERRHQEWVPECAPGGARLVVTSQPRGHVTLRAAIAPRSKQRSSDLQLVAELKVRVARERGRQ